MSKLKELLPKKQNKGDKNKQENSQQFRNRVDVLGWTHFRRKDTEYKCIDHIGVPVVATERMEATDYSMMNGCNTDEPLYQLTIQNGESDWRYHNTCLSDAYGIRISTCIKLEAIPDGIGKFPEYKLEKVYDDRLKTEQISKFEYAVIEFGCYPQDRAENSYQLEQLYQMNALQPTGKSYIGYMGKDYKLVRNPEFVFEGERYVRVLVKNLRHNNAYEFKNGRELLDDGSPCWAKVQPIRWVIRNWDELPKNINPLGSGTAEVIDLSCESSILGNIPYGLDGKNKYDNLWQNSLLRAILNGYDLQEQLEKGNGDPSRKNDINYNFKGQGFIDEAFFDYNALTKQYTQQKEEGGKIMKTRLSQLNPDKTPEESRRLMTDTEIIKSWIDAGESVLLRGPSGIGKTERIKTLYPDLIYIKLTNNMFPEKVVGSLNLQTGQSIPPDFAKEAILACANEEERQAIKENIQNIFELADIIYERSKNADKKTVILLDELLNVKPAVQSLVYSLVLNKMVEMGHGLKLPSNVVIVATGNQKKYSSIAEDLVEPLEKRFDHIYDMEPKVQEWLVDYAIPNKLHPTVISYIVTKYHSTDKRDISYFYEKPEVGEAHTDQNGCRGRTNDPRGWAALSKMLYNFEEDLSNGKFIGKNVESLLSTTINSKLRTEWAREFFAFYNSPTLSVQDVVKHNYKDEDLPTDINEKFSVMSGLLTADETEIKACRKFVKEYCSPEYLQIYDSYWAGNDDRRIEMIAELESMNAFDTKWKFR